MLELIVIVCSVLLNIILAVQLLRNRNYLKRMSAFLKEAKQNEFHRHLNLGLQDGALAQLNTQLNVLLDEFQKAIENEKRLELSHKQLIANVSHDIRTPLTSLLGFIEVLQKDTTIQPQKQQEYLEILHTKAMALYKLIEDFFELSKLESEDQELTLCKINLISIAEEAAASFYQGFEEKGITPILSFPTEAMFAWGNENATLRTLQNLLSNALKYGGEQIGITIRADGEDTYVEVWDSGAGISPQMVPMIFTRLYTAETSRNTKLSGNGLGLAIAKRMVEKQGGEISVSSIPNEITSFAFRLRRVPND